MAKNPRTDAAQPSSSASNPWKRAVAWSWGFTAAVLLLTATAVRVNWDAQPFAHEHYVVALVFFALALRVFLDGVKSLDWDAFSPLRLFFSLWFGALGLCWLQLASINETFTLKLWLVIALGLAGFWLGGRAEQFRVRRSKPKLSLQQIPRHFRLNWSRSRALFGITALFIVSFAALYHQYRTLGFLPLTDDDPAWGKANFVGNPFIQRFTVTFYILLAFAYLGYAFLRHFRVWYLFIALFSYAVMTLLSDRSHLLIGLVTIVVFYHFGKRLLSPKWMLVALLIGYPASKLAIDAVRYYSPASRTGYEDLFYRMGFPKWLYVVGPDYIYITGTMTALQGLIDMVPDENPYSWGYFIAYPIRAFLPSHGGRPSESRVGNLLLERTVRKYGFPLVVASYLGEPYADFGPAGVFFFSLAFGWLSLWAYERLRRGPTFLNLFLYAQLAFAIIFSVFAGSLVLIDFYWCLGLSVLLHLIARTGVVDTSRPAREAGSGETGAVPNLAGGSAVTRGAAASEPCGILNGPVNLHPHPSPARTARPLR